MAMVRSVFDFRIFMQARFKQNEGMSEQRMFGVDSLGIRTSDGRSLGAGYVSAG
jgi:hypothetical protein